MKKKSVAQCWGSTCGGEGPYRRGSLRGEYPIAELCRLSGLREALQAMRWTWSASGMMS